MKHHPKWAVHTVWSSASSFSFQYPLISIGPSNICLCPHPQLPITSILPLIFPSVVHLKRKFLHKMWPIQLAFLLCIVYRIFLSSLTLFNTASFFVWLVPTDLLHPSPAPHFKPCEKFLIFFLKYPAFSTIHSYDPIVASD